MDGFFALNTPVRVQCVGKYPTGKIRGDPSTLEANQHIPRLIYVAERNVAGWA